MGKCQCIIDIPALMQAIKHAGGKGVARAIGASYERTRYQRRWSFVNGALAGDGDCQNRAMDHDNFHRPVCQHMPCRLLASRNIGISPGNSFHPR